MMNRSPVACQRLTRGSILLLRSCLRGARPRFDRRQILSNRQGAGNVVSARARGVKERDVDQAYHY